MTQNSYRVINLDGNLKTSWATSFDGGYLIQDINDVDANVTGATLFLPEVDIVNQGQSVVLNNISATDFEVSTSASAPLTTIKAGEVYEFYLYDNTVSGGLWRVIPYGGGSNNINNVVLTSPDSSIVITNGNVTPPGGTVDFQLPESLFNLNNVATKGLVTITGDSPLTWLTRSILGGDNIVVTNGDGVTDNPIISLNNNITNVNSATLGNIKITGNIIDSNNNDMTIDTGSSDLTVTNNVIVKGNETINGTLTVNGNTIFDANVTINGVFNSPWNSTGFFSFTDNLTPPGNTIIITSKTPNIDSITGSAGVYQVSFDPPFNNTNYVVTGMLKAEGGLTPPAAVLVVSTTQDVDKMTIQIYDSAMQPVVELPYGVSITIHGGK